MPTRQLLMNDRRPTDREDAPPQSSGDVVRTDGSLLRRFRGGEQDAATTLYLRYAGRLQSLARTKTSAALATRVDAEDVVQSVFRTFFRRASEGHYDVPDGDELWKLLLVISLNKIRTLAAFHGAAKRSLGTTIPWNEVEQAASSPNDQEEALRILEMIVDEALVDLPEAQQRIIRLRIEGHAVAEIAEATQRAKRSVERVLQQFRSRMSRLLPEDAAHDRSAD